MVSIALSYREKLKKFDLFGPPESGVRGNLISFYERAIIKAEGCYSQEKKRIQTDDE